VNCEVEIVSISTLPNHADASGISLSVRALVPVISSTPVYINSTGTVVGQNANISILHFHGYALPLSRLCLLISQCLFKQSLLLLSVPNANLLVARREHGCELNL